MLENIYELQKACEIISFKCRKP